MICGERILLWAGETGQGNAPGQTCQRASRWPRRGRDGGAGT